MSRSDGNMSGPLRDVYEREIARLRAELFESERQRVRAALAMPPRKAVSAPPPPREVPATVLPDPRVPALEAELEESRQTVAALMSRGAREKRRWRAILLAVRKRLKKAAPSSAGRLAALERELEDSREVQANLMVQVSKARRSGRAKSAADTRRSKRSRKAAAVADSDVLSHARVVYAQALADILGAAGTPTAERLAEAARLARGLRLTAEAGTPGGERCDPSAVLERAIADWTPAIKARGAALETAIKPAAGPVAVRASALRALFDELLSNAAEMLPAGAQLDVVAGSMPGGPYGVAFSDNGPGLPPEWRNAPFPAEARPGPRRPGLGLTVARELVNRRGGDLVVYVTAAIKGARMTVRLPAAG